MTDSPDEKQSITGAELFKKLLGAVFIILGFYWSFGGIYAFLLAGIGLGDFGISMLPIGVLLIIFGFKFFAKNGASASKDKGN